MFALVYRWRIRPGCEARFVAAWTELTEAIASECGSLGSRLHRETDDILLAYAVWPSATQWDISNLDDDRARHCRAEMQACAERLLPDLHGEVLVDRLAPVPST